MALTKIIHDIETNEIKEITLTANEIKDIEKLQKAAAVENAKNQAEIAAKAAQRQALLSRLGITEEEARILLGGN